MSTSLVARGKIRFAALDDEGRLIALGCAARVAQEYEEKMERYEADYVMTACATCGGALHKFYPAIIGRKNLIATQFHPEKSGPAGLRLLANFAKWDGAPC